MNLSQAYEMFMQEQKFRGNSSYTLEYYERTIRMFINFCSPDTDIEDLDIMIFKTYQLHLFESRNINKNRLYTKCWGKERAYKINLKNFQKK